MKVKVGTYTGNGLAPNPVTGVGFAPTALWVKRLGTTGTTHLAIEVAGTTRTKAGNLAAAWDTQGTFTLDADGFTASNNNTAINESAIVYTYIAWGAAAADCATFSYAGDASDARQVGAIGFQPDLAFVIGSTSEPTYWRSDQVAGDLSQHFDGKVGANRIEAFHSAGITVGTTLNSGTGTYFVLCFKKVAGVLATAEYAGNGADDRSIAHGLTATPAFTIVQQQIDQAGRSLTMRFNTQEGDLSNAFNGAEAANQIQAVDDTNIQVGTSTFVNENLQTYTIVTFAEVVGGGNPGNGGGRGGGRGGGNGGGNGNGGGGGGGPVASPLRKAFWGKRRRTR